MGILRYFLALLVLSSHYGLWSRSTDFNEGVTAVTVFIIVSGFVMTKLIKSHYKNISNLWSFYLDRLCRILPLFIFYSAITLVTLQISSLGLKDLSWTNYTTCSSEKITINFFRIFDYLIPYDIEKCNLLPQSWSLALESIFYIAIPFIILDIGIKTRNVIFFCSFVVFLYGFSGLISFDKFAYFSIPGTLFIFLIGVYLASDELFIENSYIRFMPSILYSFFVGLFLISILNANYYSGKYGHVKEVMLGLVAGIPILKFVIKLQKSNIEIILGNLSYGIFLNHVLITYVFKDESYLSYYVLFEIMFISTAIAMLSYYFIEYPFIYWRHRLRANQR